MRIITLTILCLLTSTVFAINNTRFKPINNDKTVSAPAITIDNMRLIQKQEHLVDSSARITLDAQYPELDQTTSKPVQRFNDLISDIMDTETGQFAAVVDEIHGTGNLDKLDSLPNKGYSDLKISYDIVLLTTGRHPLISILFTIDSYVSGAAHPNTTHRTLNYDFATGDGIAIAELFKPNSNFVAVLNKYCAQQLTKVTNKSEKEMVDDNEINYSQWNITAKGILVTFDEFPHVYGLQQVLIPFHALGSVLNSNSIVNRIGSL